MERQVKDVLPALEHNTQQVHVLDSLMDNLLMLGSLEMLHPQLQCWSCKRQTINNVILVNFRKICS